MNWSILMSGLWRMTWQAGVLAAIVLAVRAVLGGRMSPAWRCRLVMLVAVRLLLPVLPASSWSAFNLLRDKHVEKPVQSMVVRIEAQSVSPPMEGLAFVAVEKNSASLDWVMVLGMIWFAGAVILMGRLIIVNARFVRRVARSTGAPPDSACRLLRSCAESIGMKRVPRLVVTPDVSAPALFGIFHPILLLPMDFPQRLRAREARWVFLHELAHLRRHDLELGWITSLLQIVHWFNPLVWIAFGCWRTDMEAACDQAVLGESDGQTRADYGLLLLKFAERLSPAASIAAVGMIDDKSELRRRIASLTRLKTSTARSSVFAAILLTLISMAGLTDARGDSNNVPTTGPTAGMIDEVYDVRDLLQHGDPTQFASVSPIVKVKNLDFPFPTLASLAASIQNTVVPEAWKSGARISELPQSGQLVISATPATQTAVLRWLESHRNNFRKSECMVVISSKIVSIRGGALRELKGPAATLRPDGTTTAPSLDAMTNKELDQFNAIVTGANGAAITGDNISVISSPRITVWSGQEASICIGTAAKGSAAATQPAIDLGADGLTLDVQPFVSADRKYVTLKLKTRIRHDQMTYETDCNVSVPSDQSLIARLPASDENSSRTGQKQDEVLMVITPTVSP